MTRPRRWWPVRRRRDPSAEAHAHLRRLEAHDAEVTRLGAELREIQRANNFSGMVAAALARGARPAGGR